MADDDEAPWYRPLLVGVGALLGVALLVGAVISLVTLGALNASGLGDSHGKAQQRPTLYIPSRTPTTKTADPGLTLKDLNGGKDPSPSVTPTESPKPKKKRKPPSGINLSASPVEVSQMERIYLSGTYPGGEGASLQVQRYQGSWADFPSSTTVSSGTFSTYVMTGQTGLNKFRVVDPATGKTSNVVSVRVR